MEAKTIKKYAPKSVPKLLDLATYEFNRYIRDRDSNETFFVCISCGRTKTKKDMHAGHFYPAGHYPIVRFNEDNVHGQCVQCNYHKHGNLIEYKKHLVGKIGTRAVEKLDTMVSQGKRYGHKWERFTLIEIIEKYKAKNRPNHKAEGAKHKEKRNETIKKRNATIEKCELVDGKLIYRCWSTTLHGIEHCTCPRKHEDLQVATPKAKKTHILTMSQNFKKQHPKAGDPTHFVEKIKDLSKKHTIRGNPNRWEKIAEDVNNGSAILSIRVWSGIPYRSKQKEVATMVNLGVERLSYTSEGWQVNEKLGLTDTETLATNDGLTVQDFESWFAPKGFDAPNLPVAQEDLAIIHFTPFRYDAEPEKQNN